MMNRRDRMLIFRLTQEEYDLLREACSVRGGRSLSEFVRGELLQSIGAERGNDALHGRLAQFEQQIHRLEAAVDVLTGLIETDGQQKEMRDENN